MIAFADAERSSSMIWAGHASTHNPQPLQKPSSTVIAAMSLPFSSEPARRPAYGYRTLPRRRPLNKGIALSESTGADLPPGSHTHRKHIYTGDIGIFEHVTGHRGKREGQTGHRGNLLRERNAAAEHFPVGEVGQVRVVRNRRGMQVAGRLDLAKHAKRLCGCGSLRTAGRNPRRRCRLRTCRAPWRRHRRRPHRRAAAFPVFRAPNPRRLKPARRWRAHRAWCPHTAGRSPARRHPREDAGSRCCGNTG